MWIVYWGINQRMVHALWDCTNTWPFLSDFDPMTWTFGAAAFRNVSITFSTQIPFFLERPVDTHVYSHIHRWKVWMSQWISIEFYLSFVWMKKVLLSRQKYNKRRKRPSHKSDWCGQETNFVVNHKFQNECVRIKYVVSFFCDYKFPMPTRPYIQNLSQHLSH